MLTATIIAKQLFVPVAAWGLSLGTLTAPGGGVQGTRSDGGGAHGGRAVEGGGVEGYRTLGGGFHGNRKNLGGGAEGHRADLGLILVGNKDSRKPPPPPPPKKN